MEMECFQTHRAAILLNYRNEEDMEAEGGLVFWVYVLQKDPAN